MWIAVAGAMLVSLPRASAQHVIEFTADHDSRYKIAGQRTPEITVKASVIGTATNSRGITTVTRN